jgi:type II secretory pathway component PulF
MMMAAGIQLTDALAMMASQEERPDFADVIKGVCNDIESGFNLDKAMARYGDTFSAFEIYSIRAAFEAGHLGTVLERLGDTFNKRFQLQSKMRSSLIYPMFLLVVCLNVAVFVPPYLFAGLFDMARSSGQDLPWISLAVASFSDFVRSPACLVLLIAVVGAATWAWRNQSLRENLANEAINWNVIGPILKDNATLNFCYAWIMLMESGMALQSALPTAGAVSGNGTFARRIEQARQDLSEQGEDLVTALRNTELFSTFFLAALAVGVETGHLADVLQTVCRLQEESLEMRLESFAALVEPVILAMLGVITGTIAVAALLPIANMIGDFT